MSHSFSGRQTLHVVVLQQSREKVKGFVANELLIFGVYEAVPAALREPSKDLEYYVSVLASN